MKKVKIDDDTNEEQNLGGQDSTSSTSMTCIWVTLNSHHFSLSNMEKDIIVNGETLSDLHINFAQTVLKQQFRIENGLNSTILQSNVPPHLKQPPQIQIIHSRGNNWIVASTVFAKEDEVVVYDSICTSIDVDTLGVLKNLFEETACFYVAKSSKQTGGKDCGIFAIATSVLLCHHFDPVCVNFIQANMRQHLLSCFEERLFTTFPMTLLPYIN